MVFDVESVPVLQVSNQKPSISPKYDFKVIGGSLHTSVHARGLKFGTKAERVSDSRETNWVETIFQVNSEIRVAHHDNFVVEDPIHVDGLVTRSFRPSVVCLTPCSWMVLLLGGLALGPWMGPVAAIVPIPVPRPFSWSAAFHSLEGRLDISVTLSSLAFLLGFLPLPGERELL